MNTTYHPCAQDHHYGLYQGAHDHVHIELGDNGYSICRNDNPQIGDCIIEGIPELGIAHELSELLIGEFETRFLDAQQRPGLVFG
ncbi:MAG: hypothetical protein H7834_13660 [Magnetococcus sp. YQC-9]